MSSPTGNASNNTSANSRRTGIRRSSYASVLQGSTQSNPNPISISQQPTQSGFLSHLFSSSSTTQDPSQLSPSHHTQSRTLARDVPPSRPFSAMEAWERTLPPYSGLNTHLGDGAADPTTETRPSGFFVPTYLHASRHVERLQERERAKAIAQKDTRSTRSSNAGSLSTSASSMNLGKMVPSHRGMTHEIVERPFHHPDDILSALPTRWSATDKFPGLELEADALECKFAGSFKNVDDVAALRTDYSMPRECGMYYFEITVLQKGKDGQIGIGFSGPKVPLNRPPGWEHDSWAYHGDDGYNFCQTASGKPYGPKFGVSDVVGCGVNFRTGEAFFTKNGVNLGVAFRDIRIPNLFPSIGMKSKGENVRANFGATPFVFDIDGLVAKERAAIKSQIDLEDGSLLHRNWQEPLIHQELIAQYLAHEGFIETAKAFGKERRINTILSRGVDDKTLDTDYEDADAVLRHRIRLAILDGDMDHALKLTKLHYPTVLTENENINFKLKCRKFIELIRRSSETQPSRKQKHIRASSRRSSLSIRDRNITTHHSASSSHNDVFDGQMELDTDQDNPIDDMDVEEPIDITRQTTLMDETLSFGQILQSEFKDDPRREVKQALEDTFALIAYPDASESSLAHLLNPKGRAPVAEELNSAILVSLGKSSSALLERLCHQSEALLSWLGMEGDAASLVNVREDYLV